MNTTSTPLAAAAPVGAPITAEPVSGSVVVPSIDALHRDIAFANSYRLELIKLVMTLSAALLAFTAAFRPELQQVRWPDAMWTGWGGLALSIIGGMVHMHGWDRFYMSYRDVNHKRRNSADPEVIKKAGDAARDRINLWRRFGMLVQYCGFAVGVTGVALFAGANIDGKHVVTPSAIATLPSAPAPAMLPAAVAGNPSAPVVAPGATGAQR